MTEGEWLACTDPTAMLALVMGQPCDRKLRLFAAGRARRAGRLLALVEATERLADGRCTAVEVVLACRAGAGPGDPETAGVGRHGGWYAAYCLSYQSSVPDFGPDDADLLRELFGPLPFRRVPLDPGWLAWEGGAVVGLARSIYEEGQWA